MGGIVRPLGGGPGGESDLDLGALAGRLAEVEGDAEHDGRVEERVATAHDSQAVDIGFERALQQLRPLRGTRAVRLLEQPVALFEVDARLGVLRTALGSRGGRARREEGDERYRYALWPIFRERRFRNEAGGTTESFWIAPFWQDRRHTDEEGDDAGAEVQLWPDA